MQKSLLQRERAKAVIAQAISNTLCKRYNSENIFITDFKFSQAFANQVESKAVTFQKYLTEQNNLKAVQVIANQTVVKAQAQARARVANATGESQAIKLIIDQLRQSSLDAGIYLIPVSIALAVFAPVSGWLYDKYKLRFFTSAGLLVPALGFFILTGIGVTMSFYEVVMPLVMIGAGMGIFASPNRASIMASVPSSRRGVSAGISTTFVMIGNSFSIGLVFLIMTNIISLHTSEQLFSGSFQSTSSVAIANPIVDKFLSSIHFVFFVSAIMMLASIIPSVIRWNGTAY
jgi:MFS family permease